jgi:gliding motility-associated-like protein
MNPTHTFDASDAMEATLISSFEGCEAITTQVFLPPGRLYIPNCFTADNDGLNDVLFAYGHGLISFEWKIFNRWGELIYQSNDILQPWDGSHLDSTHYSPDGIYQYIASAKDQRGQI